MNICEQFVLEVASLNGFDGLRVTESSQSSPYSTPHYDTHNGTFDEILHREIRSMEDRGLLVRTKPLDPSATHTYELHTRKTRPHKAATNQAS